MILIYVAQSVQEHPDKQQNLYWVQKIKGVLRVFLHASVGNEDQYCFPMSREMRRT